MTAPVATSASQTSVIITTEAEAGNHFVYKLVKSGAEAPEVEYGTALEGWTAVTTGQTIAVTTDDAVVMVAEVDGTAKPVGLGRASINVG